MIRLFVAVLTLVSAPAFSQTLDSGAAPFAAAFAEPGLPPIAAFERADPTGRITAAIPLPARGQSLFVHWQRGDQSGSLSLLHVRSDGSTSVTRFGNATSDVPVRRGHDLTLTPGSSDQTPLEVVVYPEQGLVLYRWPGSSVTTPGGAPTAAPNPLGLGSPFPDLALVTLEGQPLRLSDYRGRPVVLNWWSGTCTWCVVELPGLNALVERYGDRVAFVAVGWDPQDEIGAFLSMRPFDYTQTLGGDRATALFGEAFPRHVVLDAEGRVVYDKTEGSAGVADDLGPVIDRLLGG